MKTILLSTFSAWMVRVLAILLNLVGLQLALRELGPSRFSLFLVVLSIGSWIGFANIGMGRVIANIVSRYSHLPGNAVQRFISTAVIVGSVFNIALFLTASGVFLTVMSHIHVNEVISDNYAEFVISIVSLFFALCLWFFLSIFEGIDAGHHQLHRLYLFQLVSYGASIFLLFYYFSQHASIPFAAYILNLSFLCGSIAHAVDVIRRNRSLFVWRFEWRMYLAKTLLLSSLDFTMIGAGIGILFQLSTGLIGFAVDPHAVFELGIFMRVMQSYGALIIAFTFPLTSVVSSKLATRDTESALITIMTSGIVLVAGSILASAIFYAFANTALALWLKAGVQFSSGFIEAGAVLITVCAIHFLLAAVLIAGSSIRHVAKLHFAEAIIFVPSTFVMFQFSGQTGILAALDVIMLMGCAWMIARLRHHPVFSELFNMKRYVSLIVKRHDKADCYDGAAPRNRPVSARRPC